MGGGESPLDTPADVPIAVKSARETPSKSVDTERATVLAADWSVANKRKSPERASTNQPSEPMVWEFVCVDRAPFRFWTGPSRRLESMTMPV